MKNRNSVNVGVSVFLLTRLKWTQRQQAPETLLTHIYDTGADESIPDTFDSATRAPKALREALQWPAQIKLTANPWPRPKPLKAAASRGADADVDEGGDSGIARTKCRCSQ